MRQKIYTVLLLISFFFCAVYAEKPSVKTVENPWVILRAFMVAYPDDITNVVYDSEMNDWFMTVNGERLYWAKGRLLPKDEVADYAKWRPYVDYLYPESMPDPTTFSDETIAELNADVLAESRNNSPTYNIAFYDQLYDGATRVKIESHIVRFDYLGLRVSVHKRMVPALKRVEAKLYQLAETNEEVRKFISSIGSIDGYNWREIADSPSRSNHSWGIAVDILPKNWGQKNIYWNWISYWNKKWMLIPLSRRWMPPHAVITVFEEEGFIWGGKWLLWDNMHFEYRPELLVLQKWGYKGDLER